MRSLAAKTVSLPAARSRRISTRLSSLSLMKRNVILETSRANARDGDIYKWHGATLPNGRYNHFAPNVSYRAIGLAVAGGEGIPLGDRGASANV
jgi:hypothetical protein